MTVSDTELKEQYSGNGSNKTFAFNHPFIATSDLLVYEEDDGVVTLQVEGTHYDVIGTPVNGRYPNGANVVYKTTIAAPASGVNITITRDTALTQGVDYLSNDNFPAETHEGALDKLTLAVQELQGKIDRAVKLPNTTTIASLEMEEAEADKLIGWNSTGDAIENKDFLDAEAIGMIPALAGNASKPLRVNPAGTALEFYTQTDVISAYYRHNTGANDSYTATLTPAITSYVAGLKISLLVDTGNTGGCVLDVNGLGPKAIKKNTYAGLQPLSTGDILAGQIFTVIYDGTDFQLQSPVSKNLCLRKVRDLTSGTSFTLGSFTTMIYVELVGGGGGGGAATSNASIGGGGGAGGFASQYDSIPTLPLTSISYTIGAAGAASFGGAGGNGGATTITLPNEGVITANGGTGGAANGGSLAAGGTASGGTGGGLNVTGQAGGGGGSNITSASGRGASSRFGTGGTHGLPGSGGQAASGYGAGGGGGHRDTTTDRNGGAGTQGYIRVWEFG